MLYACSWTCRKKQMQRERANKPKLTMGEQQATPEALEARIAKCLERMEFFKARKEENGRGSKEYHAARCSWQRWRCKLEEAQVALKEAKE